MGHRITLQASSDEVLGRNLILYCSSTVLQTGDWQQLLCTINHVHCCLMSDEDLQNTDQIKKQIHMLFLVIHWSTCSWSVPVTTQLHSKKCKNGLNFSTWCCQGMFSVQAFDVIIRVHYLRGIDCLVLFTPFFMHRLGYIAGKFRVAKFHIASTCQMLH